MQTSPISRQEAARELLNRRRARTNLLGFTEYTTLRWQAGKIHRAICEQLDRVVRKEIDRLMLLCPPQHGKSQITSRRFPAYVLGHEPTEDWISASATAELAEGFGRDVRNCISSREYQNVFPEVQLAEDSQAKGRWNTKQGGAYNAIGIGGQLFGKGGGAVIDDPFGSWADAQSEVAREKVWDWYQGTLYNRIRPGRPIIVIQHRMHEADLAGRLIAKQATGGDKWEIVNLPALIDDPPWPERYDSAALERIRANTDPLQWSALYQQNPMPDEGVFFKREWFEFFDPKKLPPCHKYMSGDFAVTEGGGDCTEIATHAYLNGCLHLGFDGWYGQTSADIWIEQLIDQVARHSPFAFFGETGPIRRAIEPFLLRRMRERVKSVPLVWLPRPHDKPTMARPLQAMAALRKVKIADTAYGNRLLAQLVQFPMAQTDDGVDMAALMALAVDQAHPAIIVAPGPKEPPRGARTIEEMVKRFENRQNDYGKIS
jgi:hypothetical protein